MANKKEIEENHHEDWKSMALTFVTSAVERSSVGILQAVHERIDHMTTTVIKKLIIVASAFFGVALVLVGFAQFLGSMLGASSYGYMLMGGFVLISALLMHFISRE